MDSIVSPNPIPAPVVDSHDHRKRSLVDLLYLLVSVWIYLVSLFYPLIGIVLGVVFMTWATTDDVKRMGKTCLILGIINIALLLLALGLTVALGGLASSLPFAHHWGGV
jgi:hypothetical protein